MKLNFVITRSLNLLFVTQNLTFIEFRKYEIWCRYSQKQQLVIDGRPERSWSSIQILISRKPVVDTCFTQSIMLTSCFRERFLQQQIKFHPGSKPSHVFAETEKAVLLIKILRTNVWTHIDRTSHTDSGSERPAGEPDPSRLHSPIPVTFWSRLVCTLQLSCKSRVF